MLAGNDPELYSRFLEKVRSGQMQPEGAFYVECDTNIPDGEKLTAPITAGEELGEADVIVNGVSYGTVKLVANYSVELDKAKFISSQIQNTLKTGVVRFIIFALILMFVLYIAFIIYYNVRRQKKKKAANELARQKIEAIRAKEALTTGLTFEEIEKKQELTGRYRRR